MVVFIIEEGSPVPRAPSILRQGFITHYLAQLE